MNGFVYLIQAGDNGPIKIGTAQDVLARMRGMQTTNHEKLHLRHTLALPSVTQARQTEKSLHIYFNRNRLRGEWFDISMEHALVGVFRVLESPETHGAPRKNLWTGGVPENEEDFAEEDED